MPPARGTIVAIMSTGGDRFDPFKNLPEVNPEGASQSTPANSPAGPQGPMPGPWNRRQLGEQYVRPTTDRRFSEEPGAKFDRKSLPDGSKAGPYKEQKKLKGKKAVEAYEREMAEKRAREEQAAIEAANREARGVAGFADRTSQARGVTISNPDYAPRPDYVAADAKPPKPPKKWYKKFAIMIPLSIVVTVALALGIGWPALMQVRATADADAAAAAYTRAREAYALAWSADNLDALTSAFPSKAIAKTENPLIQPADAQRTLDEQCSRLDGASRAANALTASPPPSLTQLSSTQFSSAYRQAQQADSQFAPERQAGQTLLSAIRQTMPQMQRFCTNFRLGLAIANNRGARDTAELKPLRTIPKGGVINFGERQMPCEDPAGCPNYADDLAREKYAELWRAIAEEYDDALLLHYRDQCWLDALVGYCVKMVDVVQADRDSLQSIASAMRGEKPGKDPNEPVLPKLAAAIDEANKAVNQATQAAYLEAGRVDPAVLASQEPTWASDMLIRILGQFESHLGEAASSWRQTTGI